MAALTVGPRVPMAIKQFVINVRLHFAFRFFSIATRVTRFVCAIGIDAGNEGNGLSVRGPNFSVRSGGKKREAVHRTAFDIHRKNLLLTFDAGGNERKLLAVERPAGAHVAASMRQLPRLAAGYADDPYVAGGVICLRVWCFSRVGDHFAVGRDLWLAEAVHGD